MGVDTGGRNRGVDHVGALEVELAEGGVLGRVRARLRAAAGRVEADYVVVAGVGDPHLVAAVHSRGGFVGGRVRGRRVRARAVSAHRVGVDADARQDGTGGSVVHGPRYRPHLGLSTRGGCHRDNSERRQTCRTEEAANQPHQKSTFLHILDTRCPCQQGSAWELTGA